MGSSVKRNFIFSTVLTVSNYIFPFIIYPYITRVLGVNNLGICNFVDSIINYAVIISTMGIMSVGTREIATLIAAQYFASRYTGLRFPLGKLARNLAWYLPTVAAAIAISAWSPFTPIVTMLWGMLFFVVYFIIIQHSVLHNEIYMEAYGRISLMLNKSIRK